jgi:hypothetical protein
MRSRSKVCSRIFGTVREHAMSLAALQECLAAEHAAVYGYGVVGGVLAGTTPFGSPEQRLAAAAYVEHRHRRDDLTATILHEGGQPVAAKPAYELPRQVRHVRTAADCRRLAQLLEERCGQTYADAVARSVDDDRDLTARALTACALRGAAWGAPFEPFPGLSEF